MEPLATTSKSAEISRRDFAKLSAQWFRAAARRNAVV
jgi:hypothetical protein